MTEHQRLKMETSIMDQIHNLDKALANPDNFISNPMYNQHVIRIIDDEEVHDK